MKKLNAFTNIKYLLQKEFIQILRNKTILRLIIMLPMVQLLVLPWAAHFRAKKYFA